MPDTAEMKAYKILKNLVISGDLPSDEFLSQRMLAKKVNGSVISVRGALRRLENDGLIESVPRWGVRIPVETEQTIRDRYFVRELLEAGAVERIVAAGDPGDAQVIRQAAAACDQMTVPDSELIPVFAEKHLGFHTCIAQRSRSPLLVRFMERLNMKSMMLVNARRGWARGFERSTTHHMDLADEILSGDRQRARDAIILHVRNGLKAELEAIAENNECPERQSDIENV
jgi:DNA-binding GntR family transcriptional regulator